MDDIAEVQRIILSDPDSIDHVDGTGLTPLGVAVDVVADGELQTGEAMSTEVVELLVGAGADPDHQASAGSSARQLARRYGHRPLLLLLDGRRSPEPRDKHGWTKAPLHHVPCSSEPPHDLGG